VVYLFDDLLPIRSKLDRGYRQFAENPAAGADRKPYTVREGAGLDRDRTLVDPEPLL
jgi:hypothetical protein